MEEKYEDFRIFGENLWHLRNQHGLSQEAMAQKLHIGVNTLQNVEGGIFCPRLRMEVLFYIQEEFGVQPCLMFIPEMEEW